LEFTFLAKRPSLSKESSVKGKLPLTASSAVLAICAAAMAPVQATAQGASKQELSAADYCSLVKDPNARKICFAARDQYYSNQYRAALFTIRQAVAAAPTEGGVRAMSATIMIALGDEGSAERELREARKNGAMDHVVLAALLPLMIRRHEEEQLLVEFPEPAPGAKGDGAADILFGRGKALFSLDRLPEAASELDRSLTLRRDAAGLVVRAQIADRQNDHLLAAKLVDEAVQREPKSAPAALAKLTQIQGFGDPAKTLAFSQQMLDVFPGVIEFRLARIEAFLRMNQDGKAQAEVAALQAKVPNSNFARYYNGLLLVRANKKTAAWQVMQAIPPQFVRQNPSLAISMAQLAVETGHIDMGAAFLISALSAAPELVDVRFQLASLRMQQDSPQAALTTLQPIMGSTDPRVQKLLGTIRARIAKDRAF